MSKEIPTFEEVDKHVTKHLAGLEKTAAAKPATASAAAISIPAQVCAAYKAIRPILLFVVSFPFIPGSWKKAIKIFMTFMDSICP